MKKIILLLIILLTMLLMIQFVSAGPMCCSAGVDCQDTESCRVYGTSSTLVQYKCRKVSNTSGSSLFIPHKTNLEFAYFKNAVNGYLSSFLSMSVCHDA